jgi:LAO/AO transport system kinase
LEEIKKNTIKELARTISIIEHEAEGYEEMLQNLAVLESKIIGITGPPGAGKSTLTDALIEVCIENHKRVGVICIDPASHFHNGALLGDRIRMSKWYNNPDVYIRSLSSKGSLGGLHPKIIEISDVVKAFGYDYIIIETVGVGQSEVEIASLADVTVVVLVPESGDEIQTMKAGLMEIADVFVVNKSDRPEAERFVNYLNHIHSSQHTHQIPVIKTIALQGEGVKEVYEKINEQLQSRDFHKKRQFILAEKAYQLIQHKRMRDIDLSELKNRIKQEYNDSFNLYQFVKNYT